MKKSRKNTVPQVVDKTEKTVCSVRENLCKGSIDRTLPCIVSAEFNDSKATNFKYMLSFTGKCNI